MSRDRYFQIFAVYPTYVVVYTATEAIVMRPIEFEIWENRNSNLRYRVDYGNLQECTCYMNVHNDQIEKGISNF